MRSTSRALALQALTSTMGRPGPSGRIVEAGLAFLPLLITAAKGIAGTLGIVVGSEALSELVSEDDAGSQDVILPADEWHLIVNGELPELNARAEAELSGTGLQRWRLPFARGSEILNAGGFWPPNAFDGRQAIRQLRMLLETLLQQDRDGRRAAGAPADPNAPSGPVVLLASSPSVDPLWILGGLAALAGAWLLLRSR